MNRIVESFRIGVAFLAVGALTGLPAAATQAQSLAGDALVEALADGGYVLVMRHASASVPPPRRGFGGGPPGGQDDAEREPELDDAGVGRVTGMRFAFRELGIPVGDLFTSPTLRARQHAQHLGFGDVHIVDELGTEAMQPDAERSAWLAAKVTESPRPGTNTVIVTHEPNIRGALDVAEIALGETLVVSPGNDGGSIVGRVPIEQWPRLALD